MSDENPYEGTLVLDPPFWLVVDKDANLQVVTTDVASLGTIKAIPIITESLFAERFVGEGGQDFASQEHATWHDLEANLDPAAQMEDGPTHVAIDPGNKSGRFYALELFLRYVKDRATGES